MHIFGALTRNKILGYVRCIYRQAKTACWGDYKPPGELMGKDDTHSCTCTKGSNIISWIYIQMKLHKAHVETTCVTYKDLLPLYMEQYT